MVVKAKDTLFYKMIRPLTSLVVRIVLRPTVVGLENIPKEGRILLAGNHSKKFDSIMLVGVVKRQIHFLAKEELFHGATKWFMKGMGCVPVNRKIHDKNALQSAIDYLNEDLCVGIFPEGTLNRTDDVIMPFKIGAVKASSEANSLLVPFVITGGYKLFRKSVKVEFLTPMKIEGDLGQANEQLMNIVSEKLMKEGKKSERKNDWL